MEFAAHPAVMAVMAGMLSWASVALGAMIIFAKRQFSRRTLDLMLGTAGGMMLGATFWSLLKPSRELCQAMGPLAFGPPVLGLVLGALFLLGFDRVLPHLHALSNTTEGLSTSWKRSVLLVLAMALHHIPEGLAIGVGYGAAGVEQTALELSSATVLTFSIMLQNVPEGLIVATALRAEGVSAKRACFFGILSGATAPLGAILGALVAGVTALMLPVALAFAAGAMLYVIVEEVIPESQASGNGNAATLAFIGGVILVMMLDTLLT